MRSDGISETLQIGKVSAVIHIGAALDIAPGKLCSYVGDHLLRCE